MVHRSSIVRDYEECMDKGKSFLETARINESKRLFKVAKTQYEYALNMFEMSEEHANYLLDIVMLLEAKELKTECEEKIEELTTRINMHNEITR